MEMCFDGKPSLGYYGLMLDYCHITPAVRKTAPVDVLAADGTVDAMAGFEATYDSRTVTAEFTVAGGVEDGKNRIIRDLEGRTVQIVLPDDPNYYMTGMGHVTTAGCNAGSSLVVSFDCLPWRYSRFESVHEISASDVDVEHTWHNGGMRIAVPELTVGDVAAVIGVNGVEKTIVAGTYSMPELAIPGDGTITITARGGAFTARYREAIL